MEQEQIAILVAFGDCFLPNAAPANPPDAKARGIFWLSIASRMILGGFFAFCAVTYLKGSIMSLPEMDFTHPTLQQSARIVSIFAMTSFMGLVAYLYAIQLPALTSFAGWRIPRCAAVVGSFAMLGLLLLEPTVDLSPDARLVSAGLIMVGNVFAPVYAFHLISTVRSRSCPRARSGGCRWPVSLHSPSAVSRRDHLDCWCDDQLLLGGGGRAFRRAIVLPGPADELRGKDPERYLSGISGIPPPFGAAIARGLLSALPGTSPLRGESASPRTPPEILIPLAANTLVRARSGPLGGSPGAASCSDD